MMTVCVFSGTGNGNRFVSALLSRAEAGAVRLSLHVFCATEYGAEIARNEIGEGRALMHYGRLDEEGMLEKLREIKPDYVIDCTHPYAEIVTKNIKSACEKASFPFRRLRRSAALHPAEN
ncbi:MAG: precorrin-6A/cobalt-precorrin-6A reductase, partial [Spirochaetaceae bacterium]|nr:precorrin-6A/cobalt-precorrin-6A reductase [Spirochaetaceae bacterium]